MQLNEYLHGNAPTTSLIIGSPGSGKTTFIKHLAKERYKEDDQCIILARCGLEYDAIRKECNGKKITVTAKIGVSKEPLKESFVVYDFSKLTNPELYKSMATVLSVLCANSERQRSIFVDTATAMLMDETSASVLSTVHSTIRKHNASLFCAYQPVCKTNLSNSVVAGPLKQIKANTQALIILHLGIYGAQLAKESIMLPDDEIKLAMKLDLNCGLYLSDHDSSIVRLKEDKLTAAIKKEL